MFDIYLFFRLHAFDLDLYDNLYAYTIDFFLYIFRIFCYTVDSGTRRKPCHRLGATGNGMSGLGPGSGGPGVVGVNEFV